MTMEQRKKNQPRPVKPLTEQLIQQLIKKGFRFVLIKGYTMDKRSDYMEPHYLLLVPIRELSHAEGEMEIYESLESKLLVSWGRR